MIPAVLAVSGRAWGSYLAILSSLGRKGVPVHVLSWGVALDVLRKSKYYSAGHEFSQGSVENRLADLRNYARKAGWHNRPLLYYCTDADAALVASHRRELESCYTVLMGDSETCLSLMGKETAESFARKNGLNVPETWHVADKASLVAQIARFRYPLILKPTLWNRSGGVRIKADIIRTEQELRVRAQEVLEGGGQLVVQDYVEGGDDSLEFYLFYRTRDGREIYRSTGRKLRQFPPRAGIMALGVSETLPDLQRVGDAFLEAVDFRGLGGLEFKRYRNTLYYIEINVRMEMIHKIAIESGIDLPWLAYADAFGLQHDPAVSQKDGVYFVNEVPYAILVFRNPLRFFQDCRRMLGKTVRFGMFSLDDPAPFFKKFAGSLKKTWDMVLKR